MKPSARLPPLRRPHPCSTNDIFEQCLLCVSCRRVAVKQVQRPFRIPFSKYIGIWFHFILFGFYS